MYFITTKRMLEVCFSAHPNIQYRTLFLCQICVPPGEHSPELFHHISIGRNQE